MSDKTRNKQKRDVGHEGQSLSFLKVVVQAEEVYVEVAAFSGGTKQERVKEVEHDRSAYAKQTSKL